MAEPQSNLENWLEQNILPQKMKSHNLNVKGIQIKKKIKVLSPRKMIQK